MYSCNDCGKQFEKPENNACPHCGSGDIFEEDIEEAATAEETAGEAEVETAPVEENQPEETPAEEAPATMDEVVADADEKNKKGFAASLRRFGEDYIRYRNNLECAKECIKSTFEMAKERGITKEMLLAYAAAVCLEDFNAKVLCGAIQQELGLETEETENKEAENAAEEAPAEEENTATEEESDANEEQSDDTSNE